jgi:alpha-tubulin suppressor-like RCC1 family protein
MKLAERFTRQAFLLGALLVATSIVCALAGAAPSTSAANFSARLTKTSFTSSQAGSVKLICKFSKKSGNFSYLLTLKKGKKWQKVKSVANKSHSKGAYTMTVKKLFAKKPVKVGSYRLKLSADGGKKKLSFKVVTGATPASKPSGSSPPPTVPVGKAPTNSSLPSISGSTTQGQTLTAANGSWANSPTGYTYQWRRCDSSGANCADISSATAGTYGLVFADVGSTVRVVVTASNSYGSASATSSQTAVVVGVVGPPPVNTALPTITGTPGQGQTLTAVNGTWTNSPTGYAYRWRRCDAAGDACLDISGATPSSYTLVPADVGSTIRVVVTASNSYGSASATSAQTAVVGVPPSIAPPFPPTISGTTEQGYVLTAATGLWSNTPTSFTYLWRRCDNLGANCADMGVASSTNTYTLAYVDAGSTMRVVVTASNAYGSTSATSAQTAVVTGHKPSNISPWLPSISGTTAQGNVLTASHGNWYNPPTSSGYTYQWQRCNPSCSNIGSATTVNTYTLTVTDVGSTIRVVVTATNPWGSGTATSNETGVIGVAPSNVGPPGISPSSTKVGPGQTLTVASPGSWNGSPTPSFSYQWQRCDVYYLNCADISGATLISYVIQAADIDHTIGVVVTGTNVYGSASASSDRHRFVGRPPVNTDYLPTISGITAQDQTLSATAGSWTGYLPIYDSYQWQRCNPGCSNIGGATSSTYQLRAVDVGSTIRVVDTATNDYGSASATSAQTAVVVPSPQNTGLPTISTVPPGTTPQQDHSLTATSGTWTNSPTSYTYQWQRCDTSGGNCSGIGGGGTTYTLQADDVGSTIRVVVTATNPQASTSATSDQTSVVITYALSVSAGGSHTCAVLATGVVKCWGSNTSAELGDHTTQERTAPVQVLGIAKVTQVAAGSQYTCALTVPTVMGTEIVCWGRGDEGQLGGGVFASSVYPVVPSGTYGAIQVAAGGAHTCALLSDNTVWCWGRNTHGELGNGTTTGSSHPVQVSGITNAIQISAGDENTCAVLSDHTVRCWGDNHWGQLGIGLYDGPVPGLTYYSSPVTVGIPPPNGATQVSTGAGHTCAHLVDNTIRCWGHNDHDQIGSATGSPPANPSPAVVLPPASTGAEVSTGLYHSCALLSSGLVYCWGYNLFGQLGNALNSDTWTPQNAIGILPPNVATHVSAGNYHSCATLTDGNVACWGRNGSRQLGNGSTADSWIPVTVINLL